MVFACKLGESDTTEKQCDFQFPAKILYVYVCT